MKMYRVLLSLFFLLITSTTAFAEHLKIAHISDVHLSQNGENYNNRNIEQSVQKLEKAVNDVNAMKDVDFTVFTGDNIDAYMKSDLLKFCEITSKLQKPYYVAIGNHDAYDYGELNKTEYMKILKDQNKNQKKAEPNYYVKVNNDIVLVVLDGVINKIPSSHGYFSHDTIDWLDKVLTKFKKKKVIIMQHFPLVEPYEKESHRVKYPEGYERILKNHKNVKAILSGHYHKYGLFNEDGIYHVSAPALVNFDSQYLVIDIDYDKDNFDLKTELVDVK